MMKITRNILLLSLLFLTSCATFGNSFYATDSGNIDIAQQNYNVIFYGVETPHDAESLVILDIADDDYTIAAATSSLNFSIQDNLSSPTAEKAATAFLDDLLWLRKIDKLQIITPDGKLIGYELRPIFHELAVDNSDFQSWYTVSDGNRVKFYVAWDGFRQPFDRD